MVGGGVGRRRVLVFRRVPSQDASVPVDCGSATSSRCSGGAIAPGAPPKNISLEASPQPIRLAPIPLVNCSKGRSGDFGTPCRPGRSEGRLYTISPCGLIPHTQRRKRARISICVPHMGHIVFLRISVSMSIDNPPPPDEKGLNSVRCHLENQSDPIGAMPAPTIELDRS